MKLKFLIALALFLVKIQLNAQVIAYDNKESKHSDSYYTNLEKAKSEFDKVKTLNLKKIDVLSFAYPKDSFPKLENLILQKAMSVFSSFSMYPLIKKICLINLNYNDHTQLPNDFDKYTHLEKFALCETNTDSIPSSLFKSKTIKMICLNGKKINKLPLIEGLDSLRDLHFDNTSIDSLSNQFAKLKSLEYLTFRNSNFRNIPNIILKMDNLKSIDFSGNPISILPDSIGFMKKLEALILSGTKLKYFPKSIKKSNLKYIMLDDEKYTKTEKKIIEKKLPKNCIIFWNSNMEYVINENCACTQEIEF